MKMRRQAYRRRVLRIGLVASNTIVLGVILAFVLHNPQADSLTLPAKLSETSTEAVANPLDQVSSADIALTVARMGSLPEATAINNQAQSQAAEVALAASSNNVINKPQVIETALKSSADIKDYYVKPGDTVSKIAAKFGVTSDSIRWSNDLNGDTVSAGTRLSIPPINGVVYVVKSGDTAGSLAAKFHANKAKIIAYNDAEISGLRTGQRILIPDAVETAIASAPAVSSYGGFPWGGSAPVYGYNGYDYGYCTWYVATQIAVPSNWGNASSWSYYAAMSGWNVSSRATVGSIAQTPYAAGGLGHVAIVDAVSADGSQIKIRDMNGIAGWGAVGYSGWLSVSSYPHYISR